MTARLDPSLLVLHALRLKGRADAAALTITTGLDDPEVDRILASLQQRGLVVCRPGARAGGWALTAAGQTEHTDALWRDQRGDDPADGAIMNAYRRFRWLNEPFKALCTDWQLRDGDPRAPNDHKDTTYDRHVIERLEVLHREVLGVVDDLARSVPRFAPYGPRLESAHARLVGGDLGALTTPLTDSYHDVWMELHEDLLVTLGIERNEGSA